MLIVSMNYPTPSVTLHKNPLCPIVNNPRGERRIVDIDRANLSRRLFLIEETIQFKAARGFNNLWVSIDMNGDKEFERAIASRIIRVLGEKYAPLNIPPNEEDHC